MIKQWIRQRVRSVGYVAIYARRVEREKKNRNGNRIESNVFFQKNRIETHKKNHINNRINDEKNLRFIRFFCHFLGRKMLPIIPSSISFKRVK